MQQMTDIQPLTLITPTAAMSADVHGGRAKCLQRLIRLDMPVPTTVALSFGAVQDIAYGQMPDMDALLANVDVAALAEKAEVGRLVTESSQQVAGSALDLARRQIVGLDLLITGLTMRLVGKRPDQLPAGPTQLRAEKVAAQ